MIKCRRCNEFVHNMREWMSAARYLGCSEDAIARTDETFDKETNTIICDSCNDDTYLEV